MAAYTVNQHQEAHDEPSLTYSAVYGCYKRLQPQVKTVQKGKQGSTDKNHPWCKARVRWVAQLLLRFKEIQYTDPLSENLLGEDYDVNNPPAFFDINSFEGKGAYLRHLL